VRAVARYRQAWARHFTLRHNGDHRLRWHPSGPTADTAYAWRYLNTLFVTVDEFAASRRGVRPTVDAAQLRWLSRVLAQARSRNSGVRHIVVQGHLPVLGSTAPVIPSHHSSRLFLLRGADSAFWRVLHRYRVDVYLAGEMHTYSMRDDGVMQIVPGSTVGDGHENYLVASVYTHRIVFTLKRFSGRTVGTDHLWQMSYARAQAHPVINPDPTVVARWEVP